MAHCSTNCEDSNSSSSKTDPSPAESGKSNEILRNGRFQTIKVKEDEPIPPPRYNGPLRFATQLSYMKHDGNNVVTQGTLPLKDTSAQELDPQAFVGKTSIDFALLERLQCEDRMRQANHEIIRENPKRTGSGRLFNQLRQKIYPIVRNPRKYGFKNICLLLLVLSYTLAGAAVFYVIESNYEHKTVTEHKAALDGTIEEIAKEMTKTINDPRQTVDEEFMIAYLQRAYITLLKQESKYDGSTFHKAEDMEHNRQWTFGSSCFFSMNVYTTTGYGSIAPSSSLGKACVIIYGFIFVPLTLVVIRHLGNTALVILTNFYANVVIRWRKFRSRKDVEDGEVFTLPVVLCMLFMLLYLMGTTTFIFAYDNLSGTQNSAGIDYFYSFYFSFISISTIGLGDVMPTNVTFDPIITILFFFGMPLMKVVNSSTYQSVEKATIGFLTLLENRISMTCQGPRVADGGEQHPKSRAITLTGATVPALLDDSRNDMTIRSVLTFIKSDAHVYGHSFGRVQLTARKDTI